VEMVSIRMPVHLLRPHGHARKHGTCGEDLSNSSQPEDRDSMDLRNVGVLLQHYTASHPKRPRFESSSPCRLQISHKDVSRINFASQLSLYFRATSAVPSIHISFGHEQWNVKSGYRVTTQ